MLYIRHGEKAYKNGGSEDYSLDPPLTEQGRIVAKEKFQQLIRNYRTPNKIVSSPYLRTRQTAEIAADVIFGETGVKIEILCDPNIGEYLNDQKYKDINNCLRYETLVHNPVPPQNLKQYNKRAHKHNRLATPDIWYITHGMFIQSIAYFNGTKIKYPSVSEGIYVNKGIITLI